MMCFFIRFFFYKREMKLFLNLKRLDRIIQVLKNRKGERIF